MTIANMKLDTITSIQKYDGIHYKRDDLFAPYGDINGGKVRQTIKILELCKNEPGIVYPASIHSPSPTHFSRVAKEFNIPCIICVGGTKPEYLDKHPMMKICKSFGADIKIVAGHGMKTVISHRAKQLQKDNGYYNPDFSKHIHTHKELMFINAKQVSNIPDNLDVLIMSVGSGIQFANVLKGIHLYKKSVKRVIGICVGPDRRKLIDSYLNDGIEYKYELALTKSAYSKPVKQKIDDFELDDLYEAKAYKWMLKNIDLNQNILFWCVGRRFFNGVE
jgi:1-aminocyclopropane-1-carboxylate deaminase/D-cysteine desulfhydrase-like pyridoxal-dependent ACC family enzyme